MHNQMLLLFILLIFRFEQISSTITDETLCTFLFQIKNFA